MKDRGGRTLQTKGKVLRPRSERTLHITEVRILPYDSHGIQLSYRYRRVWKDEQKPKFAVLCLKKKLGLYPEDTRWKEGMGIAVYKERGGAVKHLSFRRFLRLIHGK